MNWEKREKFFPPGYEGDREIWILLAWVICAVISSFQFFPEYVNEYELLWNRIGHVQPNGMVIVERVLWENAKMPSFSELIGDSLRLFWMVPILLIAYGIMHYVYYYQESKSILLVRRLPDRWFVWKTCVAGPLIGAVFNFSIMGIQVLLYYGTYLLVTPSQCLP